MPHPVKLNPRIFHHAHYILPLLGTFSAACLFLMLFKNQEDEAYEYGETHGQYTSRKAVESGCRRLMSSDFESNLTLADSEISAISMCKSRCTGATEYHEKMRVEMANRRKLQRDDLRFFGRRWCEGVYHDVQRPHSFDYSSSLITDLSELEDRLTASGAKR